MAVIGASGQLYFSLSSASALRDFQTFLQRKWVKSLHEALLCVQTFGKAGSAALGAEADGIKPGGKKGRGGPGGAGQIELKTSAGRGLYAGPAASGRGQAPLMLIFGNNAVPLCLLVCHLSMAY